LLSIFKIQESKSLLTIKGAKILLHLTHVVIVVCENLLYFFNFQANKIQVSINIFFFIVRTSSL